MSVFAVAASLATGLMLGLFGSGGSIITLPALMYLLGVEAKPAIAMSLGIVAVTAAIGAGDHWRKGNVNLGVAGVFAVFGAVGTYAGARLGVVTPAAVQLGLFALVMYAAAWRMLRPSTVPARTAAAQIHGDGTIAALGGLPVGRIGHIALHGLLVGALTGLVGVGGGFMIVPALVLLSGLPMKQAVGTSLAVVAAKSVVGFVGYVDAVAVDYVLMTTFTAIAVCGGFVGSYLAGRLPADLIKRGFAWFLVAIATLILVEQAW